MWNRKMRKRLLQLFVIEIVALLIGMTTGAFAQDREWSLKRCLEFAIDNSLAIEQAEYGIENAKIGTKLAEGQRYPNLNFGTNLGLNFGRTIDPTSNEFVAQNFLSNGYQLSSNYTVFDGGRIKNNLMSAQQEELATSEDLTSSMVNLAFDIARTYFNALLAQENVGNIQRMNKMIEVGTRAQAEIYDLEAQLATSDQDLALAQNSFEIAMVALKALMNIGFDTEMILVEPNLGMNTYSNPDELSFEEAFQKALEFSPSNRARQFRIKSAEYDLQAAEAGLLPSVNVGGSINSNYSNRGVEFIRSVQRVELPVTINGMPALLGSDQVVAEPRDLSFGRQIDQNLNYGVGLGVNVPIYNNYQVKGNIARSKVNLDVLKNQERQANNDLRNTIQQLLTDARGAKRTLEASEKTLRAREIAMQNAEKRFQVGTLNSFDYISIQNQYNQSLINLSIAKYDYLYKLKILDYYQGYPVEF